MGKDKTTAVLMAVFLSYWTWLYTYKQDKVKFWIGLGVSFVGLFFLLLPTIGIWVWAIIDRTTKDDKYYKKLK